MGTGNLTVRSAGIFDETHLNEIISALLVDLVPRNSTGQTTDIAGGLGSSDFRYNRAFVESIVLGAVASGIKFDSDANGLFFNANSAEMLRIGKHRNRITIDGTDPGMGGVVVKEQSSTSLAVIGTAITDISGLEVTLTTSGRPVWIGLISAEDFYDETTIGLIRLLSSDPDDSLTGYVEIYNETTAAVISRTALSVFCDTGSGVDRRFPCSIVKTIARLPAGTHTIKIRAAVTEADPARIQFFDTRLVAFELTGF